jgi:hypothetical protein
MQLACLAFSRTRLKTGNRIAARMAIIAITTSNSMRVNAECTAANGKERVAGEETFFLTKVQPRIFDLPPSPVCGRRYNYGSLLAETLQGGVKVQLKANQAISRWW